MKIMVIGDLHFRATSPRNRKDDYLKTLEAKLLECWEIAKRHDVSTIVQVGDIFHSPEVAISTLLKAVEIFDNAPVDVYTMPGNHDLHGYNLESYHRTSLRLLDMLSDRLNVVGEIREQLLSFLIEFKPYTSTIDNDYSAYQAQECSNLKVLVMHSMLLDHDLPYQAKYTNLYKLDTNADIIISGHDHVGYGVIKRKDGKLFVNPGALMRLTASVAEMERQVQVAIVDLDTRTAELVPILTAPKAVEVLDRSALEEKKEREYALEEFAMLIKENDGKACLSVTEIVEQIGQKENISPKVIEKAIEIIRSEM